MSQILRPGQSGMVDASEIGPLEGQPRQHFGKEELRQLADSMKEVGQVQPCLVMPASPGEKVRYSLLDGERRWRACKLAHLQVSVVVVGSVDAGEQYLRSAVANTNRVDLSPYEKAHQFDRLKKDRNMTDEQLAATFGVSVFTIGSHLAILQMDPRVQALMHPGIPEKKRLGLSIAYVIYKRTKEHPDVQYHVAKKAIEEGWRQSEVERTLAIVARGLKTAAPTRERAPRRGRELVVRTVERIDADLGLLVSWKDDAFVAMFDGVSVQDRARVRKQIKSAITKLERLHGLVP